MCVWRALVGKGPLCTYIGKVQVLRVEQGSLGLSAPCSQPDLACASQQAAVRPRPSFSHLGLLEASGPLLRQFLLLTILHMKPKIPFP